MEGDITTEVLAELAKHAPRFVNPQLVGQGLSHDMNSLLTVVDTLEKLVKTGHAEKVEILSHEHDPEHPARAIPYTGYRLKA